MKAHQPDYILISLILSIVAFGLIIIANPSIVLSQEIFEESYYFLKHQGFSVLLGLIFFFIVQRINYKYWQRFAFPLLILSVILLSLVFIPGLGYGSGQAKRWIILGIFSFQPFELVRLTFILYLAALLGKKGRDERQIIKQSLIPFSVAAGVIALLVMAQPDFSALFILITIALIAYFLAGLNIFYLLGFAGLSSVGFLALIKMAVYRMNRLIVYFHPEMDPQGIGYQIDQALLAIGSGGLFGLGLGHSIQKWRYLPEPIGDSIFAIIAEELGLIGAGLLVVLFVLLAWRGLKIARGAPDKFGLLLAGSITGWFFIQVFINMASISNLIPLAGLPLPLISYGGSAMVVSLISLGILVNISKYTN